MEEPLAVLVVDDEPNIRATLSMCLESLGCRVHNSAGAREALVAVEQTPFDIAFLDVRLGHADGLALLPELLQRAPQLSVVMISAYATIESAVQAMRAGAADYLPKPFTPAQIRQVVEHLRQRRQLENEVLNLQGRLAEGVPGVLLETGSASMRAVLETLSQAAASDASVLLRGESGTGKGVLARLVHARSPRANGRFVTVNCPTLTDELLASELFGHARGAFTGAVRDQPGKVEEADGGTLLLDEVGEISAALQAKLLRFSQDREFERVGETRTRRADVRIVAATNRDLEADVEQGSFRLDLLYRLNVIEVRVPPLRERREDLVTLAHHFIEFFARDLGRRVPQLSPEASELLQGYRWPGNVRELRNEMERAIVLLPGDTLWPHSFSERVRATEAQEPRIGGRLRLEDIEREHILRVLASTPTREEAARVLGIDPSTLWRRLRRYETEGGST